MQIVIVLDSSDLREKSGFLYSTLVQGAREALRVQAGEAYNRVVSGAYWRNRTGHTRGTFRIVSLGPLALRLESRDPVAGYLDGGTRPHTIRPRTKKALAFFWAKVGADVMFAEVRHPGTKAIRFTKTEEWRGMADLGKRVREATDRAIQSTGLA